MDEVKYQVASTPAGWTRIQFSRPTTELFLPPRDTMQLAQTLLRCLLDSDLLRETESSPRPRTPT